MKTITINNRARYERATKIKAIAFVVVCLCAAVVVALDLFVWRAAA